jgi:hypothetical protein
MSYHAMPLGAEPDTKNILKKCGVQLKDANLDTKSGREQVVQTSAECAADGFCAAYSKGAIPPGTCGPIAKAVAGEAIKVWNSIFGDDSAQRRHQQHLKEQAGYAVARKQLADAALLMDVELMRAAAGLIKYHDALIPTRRGAYGGKKPYARQWGLMASVPSEGGPPTQSVTMQGYEDDAAMRQLLSEQGLVHDLHPVGKAIVAPRIDVQVIQGAAKTWAASERQRLMQLCDMQQPKSALTGQRPGGGMSYNMCITAIPSPLVLETQYVIQLAQNVPAKFYESLDKAALRARAVLAAEATRERARLQAQHATRATVRSETTFAQGGALLLVGGAAAAAILIWRRKR